MVTANSNAVNRDAKHKLEIKKEILLAVDSFLLSHPHDISQDDWLKLISQLLGIINTRRI